MTANPHTEALQNSGLQIARLMASIDALDSRLTSVPGNNWAAKAVLARRRRKTAELMACGTNYAAEKTLSEAWARTHGLLRAFSGTPA